MAKIEYPKYKIVTDPDSHKRHGFRFGDVVRRQYADASVAVYSLMIVLEAGTEMIAGKESHYFIGALIEGDEPQAGELLDFVRVTSLIDPQREGAIYLTASDSDSPYMDIIDGLGSEFSLSYPQQLVPATTTSGKYNYIRTGGNYFSYEYKESEDEVSRIVRIVRQTPSQISLSGVRVILEEKIPNPEKLVICYRARASHRCEDMVVYFAYYTGDGMDYMDPVIVDTQWEYHVAVISVDWTGSKSKALNFNFQNNADNTGQWIEIADLNVIRLADLSNFGRATKGRTGRLTGVIDPVFGVLDGYGAYFQNLYATRNVNIAGTLTAGDENGFSSTFYVGKIHKNALANSMALEFSGKQGTVSAVDNPVGIGNVYDIGFGKTLVVQSREWSESRIGRRYCFSVWLQCDYQCAIKVFQNGHQFAVFLIPDGKKWMRHHGSFILSDTEGSDVTITFDSQYAGPKICAPQLEAGSHPSQYQPTDGTLSYVEDYGAWFSKGGIGGTIQNPLLKLNPDGSISSRDNSFVINPDGTGHFAGGRFRWTGSQITLQDVTIRWEDLSEEARENLKGEPGVDGSDGKDGIDGKDGEDGAQGVAGPPGADGQDGVDANLLDWVDDWDNNKTLINSTSVITPKILAGVRNANGTITGTAIGRFTLLSRNASGQFQSEQIDGVYGFRDGYRTFSIDNTGNVELGRGDESVRYDALTGKIVFGSAVSMQWVGATYIGANGLFTGTLSADTVNAIRINASQITAGTISAERIDVGALQVQLITAGNIEALTLNVVRGTIGGFTIDSNSIFSGAKNNTAGAYTAASGAITIGSAGIRGFKWKLDATGAGAVAGGNISWDAAGNVTFGSSVSLTWTTPINNITTALGGSAFPKMTYISGTGIYTGTLTTEQINAVSIDAGSIKTGFLSADRIAAGSIKAEKLDAASIRASIIHADYINGLSLTFVRGLIGGWSIDSTGIYTGSFGTVGALPVQLRTASSGSGNWYSGAYKPYGLSLLWYRSGNAGHIVFGQVAASGNSVKTGFYGVQMMSSDGLEYFCLSANTTLSASQEVYNRIAGWAFNSQSIWKNNVSLGADGSISNGTKWQLLNDGAGRIADGNISWDAAGNVTFGSSVSLNWATPINNITTALGGSAFPKMTHISGTGIYTGTLTANQVNAVGISAASITTGTLSADRIAAGSIDSTKINVSSLQASIVTAGYIEGLTLNFSKGKIGGWAIGATTISSGGSGSVGTAAAINIASSNTGSGYVYSQAFKPMGLTLTWHQTNNAGHLVLGQVMTGISTVKTGYMGLQMMDHSGREYFCLSALTTGTTQTVYNRIAGWIFDFQQIYKNSVYLSADGSIYHASSRWRLNNDGSGSIANGNISWDAAGNVTFSATVALNWSYPEIAGITNALGGTSYPKLTKINSTGIYTGTISASQVTVDSTLIVGGSSYNGSISVRDAGNVVKVTLDRTGITAVGGKVGGWNITSTSIYAGSVYLSSAGTIYNGNYWRLNNDGSGLLAANNIFWDSAGNLTMKNATAQDVIIKGTIRAPFVRVDGSIIIEIGGGGSVASRPESEKYDNMCVIAGTSGGWGLEEPALPWNVEQSGRRLCLTHYRYNNEIVSGYCTFTAPSGYYFYEYGRQSTTLDMSRETIELMGYGTSTQFYGWIVLNRRDLLTTGRYGAYQQYLAMGRVMVSSASSYSLKYKTYDGGVMSMARNGVGLYTINMPWSLGTDSYMVMLSGKWLNTPIYATIKSQSTSSFQVQTQDDPTANEGGFNFIVISTADFK